MATTLSEILGKVDATKIKHDDLAVLRAVAETGLLEQHKVVLNDNYDTLAFRSATHALAQHTGIFEGNVRSSLKILRNEKFLNHDGNVNQARVEHFVRTGKFSIQPTGFFSLTGMLKKAAENGLEDPLADYVPEKEQQ